LAGADKIRSEMANANGTHPAGGHLCTVAAETRALAESFAASLAAPSAIALDGPLGAGKTEFVKGLAAGLGCTDNPSSPTFAIAHEYGGGRMKLFHFDFYRMESEAEILTSGVEECFGEGIVVIEWAEKFPGTLPDGSVGIRIEVIEGDVRRITFQ